MKWLVYRFNCNTQKIEVYNIFNHGSFKKYVDKALKECETKEDFAYQLNNELRYYFWAKAEWEIIIKPWVGGRDGIENKIDVYSQVVNNWDVFVDYCWSFKNKI